MAAAAAAGGGGGRSGVAARAVQQLGSAGVSVSLSELNPHFVCVLCFGYFVDATTITECMHTFCKSCIVNFLRTKRHCPRCDTLLTKTRPYNSLRADRVMQALVFKTVPGLFQMEMRRRIEFYQGHPHADYEQDVEDFQHYVFSPDDSVSLSIRYYNFRDEPNVKKEQKQEQQEQQQKEQEKKEEENKVKKEKEDDDGEEKEEDEEDEKKKQEQQETNNNNNNNNKQKEEDEEAGERGPVVRYFRCPATVPVAVLKTLVKTKYRVPDPFRVELLYGDDRLLDSWTLMEVAYIYMWKREAPMELSFQVVATRKVRKRRQQSAAPNVTEETEAVAADNTEPPSEEPPDKVARLEEAPCTNTTAVLLSDDQPPIHPQPPTPPETPEGGRGREGEQFAVEGQTITDLQLPHGDDAQHMTGREAPTLEEQQDTGHVMEEEAPQLQAEVPFNVQENGVSKESPQREKNEPDGGDADSHHMEANEDFDTSKESNELIVDHDSETPLEVDTSHETEPEGEGEGDADGDHDGEQNGDREKGGDSSGNSGVDGETDSGKHCRDDEQEDSAIDVTENSASEPMDSDDKDTDLNVSTESTELEVEEQHESNTTTREVQTDEGPINLSQGCRGDKSFRKDCYVFTDNEDDEDDCGDQEEERDEMGALDLSRHARSVREARTQRESLESPPSDGGKGDNRNARGQGTQTILSITQSKKSKKLKQQSASTTGPATPTAQTASIVSPITRPPMPLDWACSPLVPTPVNPQAVGFHDLMTLSHAAVQLQLMAHHAQAQAQVQQAQARAQAEVQARAQAHVLKSLKSTESLSFINGSGDTLTISPITTSSQEVKSKTTYSKAVTKTHHTPKTVNGSSYSKNFSSKSHHTHKSGGSITSPNNNNNNNNNKVTTAINHGSIRTTIPKSALAASLKIPNVSSVSSKTNGTTSLSSPKPEKDHQERTGDPVFKITNQKLQEFVRRQHQEQRMKQRNNFKSSTTSTTTTTSSSSNLSSSTSSSTCPSSKGHSNTSLKVSPSSMPTTTSLSSSVSRPPTGSSQSIRATNTSVRQIPNPSLIRQQSESRITSGLTGLGLGPRRPSESISRIESLTRSLHEKVAASSLAATINSAAR